MSSMIETYSQIKARFLHEVAVMMRDEEYAVAAFLFEMHSIGYHSSQQPDFDVLSRFGSVERDESKVADDYLDELGAAEKTRIAYHRAKADYLRACFEDGRL